MRKFRRHTEKNEKVLSVITDLYYNNKDLKLLLDLLAEGSGVASSIRIMSQFDPDFYDMCQPGDLDAKQVGDNIVVEFQDAKLMTDIFAHLDEMVCIFIVEINSALERNSVMAFKFESDDSDSTLSSIPVSRLENFVPHCKNNKICTLLVKIVFFVVFYGFKAVDFLNSFIS